jgi:hypothetical protein
VDTEAVDIAYQTIRYRLDYTHRAQTYLDHMSDAIDILQQVMADNGSGEFTYALRALVDYLDRLRLDARSCIVKAQGIDDD